MRHLFLVFVLAALPLAAQNSEDEQLRESLGEAGSSPVEVVRVLERFLEKFPEAKKKEDIERVIARAAADVKDWKRAARFGERVIARGTEDPKVLAMTAQGLLKTDPSKEAATRALEYAKKAVALLEAAPPSGASPKERAEQQSRTDTMLADTLRFLAEAHGRLDARADALAAAQRSFDLDPTAESARLLAAYGPDPARAFALAAVLADSTEEAVKDRAAMRAAWRRTNADEAGVGAVFLEAVETGEKLRQAQTARYRHIDPNYEVEEPMGYTLGALEGAPLALSNLKGKVVVFDFWATWCGPCRAQYPLYQQVKTRFKADPNVVFLAVNTDEDRSGVPEFLDRNKWARQVYFDDGLASLWRVSSIPTTIVVNRRGEIVSRMNGYVPDRFVDMLSDRIKAALED
jgi:thiol-disulfide isomerase/thioredoxin